MTDVVPDVAGRDLDRKGGMDDATALRHAYQQAVFSPDPSTQNGAVVVGRDGALLGRGTNTFPAGVAQTPERWERPAKYDYVVHAEVATLFDALRDGHRLRGCTLAVVWYACTDCAKAILSSGVTRVVGHADLRQFAEQHSPGWSASIATALSMLTEAGIECDWYEGPIERAPAVRVGGQTFNPATCALLA